MLCELSNELRLVRKNVASYASKKKTRDEEIDALTCLIEVATKSLVLNKNGLGVSFFAHCLLSVFVLAQANVSVSRIMVYKNNFRTKKRCAKIAPKFVRKPGIVAFFPNKSVSFSLIEKPKH